MITKYFSFGPEDSRSRRALDGSKCGYQAGVVGLVETNIDANRSVPLCWDVIYVVPFCGIPDLVQVDSHSLRLPLLQS